ncbi:hypothetical protein OnM2_016018 [Erysiphe neolycopersici]|uniref:U6 snRNA-associated Sm-like protein LSm6 n=1 Tax=Erysiphe neolycopersici TaxID=212602 RepID=A0A420I532_9PEZI|nr:hypothetical protein OnM2_016018 [Erysiphe neolycopersici]
MENGQVSINNTNDPSSFLSEIIGSSVTVKLNSGIIYKGELVAIDGYMNISLEKCEEIVEGSKKFYGDAFVRGNNVWKLLMMWNFISFSYVHLSSLKSPRSSKTLDLRAVTRKKSDPELRGERACSTRILSHTLLSSNKVVLAAALSHCKIDVFQISYFLFRKSLQ